jgi:hypothetical protein
MMTSTFTSRPLGKHESYFYFTATLHKRPYGLCLFTSRSLFILKGLFSFNNINLTPNIIFPLGFKATFQSTHPALKNLYCIEITNIPLALCITHIKHVYFTLEFSIYIPYYLDVTAFPPKKNLVPRFGSRIELNDQI